MKDISLYIHYPFCASKCPYCDFNSYVNLKIEEEILLKCYCNELNFYNKYLFDKNIKTVYFGGGTPSLMSSKLIDNIFNKIDKLYKIDKNCEITFEANPNSITLNKMKEIKNIGINRISIGIQSLYDEVLNFLGRIHNRKDAINSINNAQKIFKDKYTIDLIYTRPNQELKKWQNELEEAIKLSPFHISLYQLIIEKGTQFYKNKIQLPNENESIKFYEFTRNFLEKNNLKFYEISNYSQKGYESKHNLTYWKSGEWLGIGAGAHSRINHNNKRYSIQNIKLPTKWVEKCLKFNNGISVKNHLTNQQIIEEFVLMGLRIKDGINDKKKQKNIINCPNNLYNILNYNNIKILKNNKLLKSNETNIKLTKKGFLLLNSIIEKLLI